MTFIQHPCLFFFLPAIRTARHGVPLGFARVFDAVQVRQFPTASDQRARRTRRVDVAQPAQVHNRPEERGQRKAATKFVGAQRSGYRQGTIAVPVQHRLVFGRKAHNVRPRRW